jgi:hypothetical protein
MLFPDHGYGNRQAFAVAMAFKFVCRQQAALTNALKHSVKQPNAHQM